MLGDTVNLASRLENLTKYYNCQLIISEATMALIGTENRHQIREIDLVSVKGRLEPLQIYEVFDADRHEQKQAKLQSRDNLGEAIQLYRRQCWDDALERFENCETIGPEDPLVQIYINRCRHNGIQPPGPDWNGVHAFDHK